MYANKDLEKITLALSFLAYEGGEKEISKPQTNQYLEQYGRWMGSIKPSGALLIIKIDNQRYMIIIKENSKSMQ